MRHGAIDNEEELRLRQKLLRMRNTCEQKAYAQAVPAENESMNGMSKAIFA